MATLVMSSPPAQASSSTPTQPKPSAKRACDQCHGQKLACSGTQPCKRCARLTRKCTYLNPRRNKGPAPRSRFIRYSGSDEQPKRRRLESMSDLQSAAASDTSHNPWSADQAPDPHLRSFSYSAQGSLAYDPDAAPLVAIPAGPGPSTWQEHSPSTWAPNSRPSESFLQLISSTSDMLAGMPEPSAQLLTYSNEPSPAVDPAALQTRLGTLCPPSPVHSITVNTTTAAMQDAWLEQFIARPDPAMDCVLASEQFTLSLLTETLFRPQISVYFDRINPMMPVLERNDVLSRLDDPEWLSARDNLALVLVTTGLALVHPFTAEEKLHKADREKQALMLLDRACRLVAAWDYGCVGTVEKTLTSFVSFGILHELGHGGGARLRLRDAISMAESMGLNLRSSYVGLTPWEARRRLRLFYILALTERAYALQRPSGGPLAFQGEISGLARNVLKMHSEADDDDPVSLSLHHLSRLFAYIDKDWVACWNQTCSPATCKTLDKALVTGILVKLNGTAERVFPSRTGLRALTEAQRADLLVTWQWIKGRVWTLALAHGLTDESGPAELRSGYVLDTAFRLVQICDSLTFGAMECHGTGFVEKLYDVALLTAQIVVTLPSQPVLTDKGLVKPSELGIDAAQRLQSYVARHHRGKTELGQMLQNAIGQARHAHRLATVI